MEMLKDMSEQYYAQKNELELFEYCISILNPKMSAVIQEMVYYRETWEKIAEKYNMGRQTVGNYRRTAILKIAQMMDTARMTG